MEGEAVKQPCYQSERPNSFRYKNFLSPIEEVNEETIDKKPDSFISTKKKKKRLLNHHKTSKNTRKSLIAKKPSFLL